MSASGNKNSEGLGMKPAEAAQTGWAIACILAVPVASLFRCEAGNRYWRGSYLLGVFFPMLTLSMQRHDPWDPQTAVESQACVIATGVLFLMFLARVADAEKQKGKEHSQYCGRTIGCSKVRPAVEFTLGLILAWVLSFVSEALSVTFTLSATCDLIALGLTLAKERITVERSFDEQVEGRLFSERMQEFRDR